MGLMRRAGAAVAAVDARTLSRAASVADVLCGPGNNGGDGYVVATSCCARPAMPVRVWALGKPRAGTDAAIAAACECRIASKPLARFSADAGFCRRSTRCSAQACRKPVEGDAAEAIEKCNAASVPVVAVDLPSGVSGDSGENPRQRRSGRR